MAGSDWGYILRCWSRNEQQDFLVKTSGWAQAVTSTTLGATPFKNLFWLPVTGRRQNDWQCTNRSRNTNSASI